MGEPQVRLILFSGIDGAFCDEDGSHSACDEAYRRITGAGVEVVFVTGAQRDAASRVLEGLEPEPVLLAGGDQRAAVEGFVDAVRESGDIPVSIGISGSPEDTFLPAVGQAAVIPGDGGEPHTAMDHPRSAYVCKRSGWEGWIEWADMLLRRIDLASLRR